MSKQFTARQANGLNRFFDSIGVAEEDRDINRLVFVGAKHGDGACFCGHPIKNQFLLTDREKGGTLVAGSECILSYPGAQAALKGSIKEGMKRLKAEAKDAARQQERDKPRQAKEYIERIAGHLDMMEHPKVVRVMEMIDRQVENGWKFSDKQEAWAKDVMTWLRDENRKLAVM